MYSLADYESHYKDCVKSLDLIKKIAQEEAFKKLLPSPAIKELRRELIRIFQKPELSQICKKCRGDCCITHNFHLTPFELLCFVIDSPDFVFPEPDRQFLEEELRGNKFFINNRCLFLSDQGCLLKEHRPMICLLFYDCQPGFKANSLAAKLWGISESEKEKLRKIFFQQAPSYGEAKDVFCLKLIRNAGIPDNSLSAIETKGVFAYGLVGSRICLETLNNLLHTVKKKSP